MDRSTDRVRSYFHAKARQLLAAGDLTACEHHGLAGGHREEVQRVFLREVFPRRYGVGRGMVYGLTGRSRETDIVVWDELNYPRLPMVDHSFFFAESVRVVVESKSRWSQDDLRDVLAKSGAVRDLLIVPAPNLDDTVLLLQADVLAMRNGSPHSGVVNVPRHIGTAAVFLSGGMSIFRDGQVAEDVLETADYCWPDALLFLEPGRLVLKEYSETAVGRLLFFELGMDALLGFTNALLHLVADRSVHTEGTFYLEYYAQAVIDVEPYAIREFQVRRVPPGRRPLWEK